MKQVIKTMWGNFKSFFYPYRYLIYLADVIGVLLLIVLILLGVFT